MLRTISAVALCAALSYAPSAFAQAAGGGNELPSNAKSSPTATSGVKDGSGGGSASKSGGSMEKSGGNSSSSDASTGNAEKSGTTLGGDQKDAK